VSIFKKLQKKGSERAEKLVDLLESMNLSIEDSQEKVSAELLIIYSEIELFARIIREELLRKTEELIDPLESMNLSIEDSQEKVSAELLIIYSEIELFARIIREELLRKIEELNTLYNKW